MKAELIETKHGLALQITALGKEDKMKIAAFMQHRKQAHKPRLKILPSPDEDTILNIGFIKPINDKYLNAISIDYINLDGFDQINFPKEFILMGNGKILYEDGKNQIVIFQDDHQSVYYLGKVYSGSNFITFLGYAYTVVDIEKIIKLNKKH